MNHLQSMQNWLKSYYGINVSSSWLTACLEWIEQDNETAVQSISDLQCKVFEQWLMSDLSEIGENILPLELSTYDNTELTGLYPLQVISHLDVGRSLYSQLQGLENEKDIHDESMEEKKPWMTKPSRMLLLHLTDGHTQVKAIEHQPVQVLNRSLPYGIKLLLQGTLKCRKGIILLTPNCIQILGGELENVDEGNKPTDILKKLMLSNKEFSDCGSKSEFSGSFYVQNKIKFDKESVNIKKENAITFSTQNSFHDKKVSMVSNSHYPIKVKNENISDSCETVYSHGCPTTANIDEWPDDMDYCELFEDDLQLKETEPKTSDSLLPSFTSTNVELSTECKKVPLNKFQQNSYNPSSKLLTQSSQQTSHVKNKTKPPSSLSTIDQWIKRGKNTLKRSLSPNNDEMIKNQSKVKAHNTTQSLHNSSLEKFKNINSFEAQVRKTQNSHKKPSEVIIIDDTVRDECEKNKTLGNKLYDKKSISQDENSLEKVIQPINHHGKRNYDCSNKLPYQYLADISQLKLPSTLIVKAFITTLTEKLGSSNGHSWTLSCRINDGTACLDVDLDNEVLTKLIGFTAQSSLEMRLQMKTLPHVKEHLMKGLSQCQEKLINMSCLMEIEVLSANKKPVIKKLSQVTTDHINQLLDRLEMLI